MKEQLVEFETAKLAKEKGFNYPTSCGYEEKGEIYRPHYWDSDCETNMIVLKEDSLDEDVPYLAPTQALLQRWLRGEHNIVVVLIPERYSDRVNYLIQAQKWYLSVDPSTSPNFIVEGGGWFNDNGDYPTYERALEKGLQEALKLIK